MTMQKNLTATQATDLLKLNVLEKGPRIGVEIVNALDILKSDLDSYSGYLNHSCDQGLVYFNRNELEMRAGFVQDASHVLRPQNDGRVSGTGTAREV